MTSYRGSDATFWLMLERLLEQREHVGGVSVNWVSGADWRVAARSKDDRRDLDLPGIRSELDETDFDVSDTDVDP